MLQDALYAYIEAKSLVTLSDTDKVYLANAFKVKKVKKRQFLLQEGEVCKQMAFVVKGAGKMYAVKENGQENIVQFAVEGWWLGDYESYNLHTPSMYNIDLVEDAELLLISYIDLQVLLKEVPAFDLMVKAIDKQRAIAMQKRIHAAISLSAEERYHQLATTYPTFLQRFPQGMIASYLGITPETLSRIRKSALTK